MINWGFIGEAVEYYTDRRSYTYVEVPWIIPSDVIAITCPDRSLIMEVPGHGGLVGSSEQSFLYLDKIKSLPKGKYVACSPCFRPGVVDKLHQIHFMKVELFQTDDVSNTALDSMIHDAENLMEELTTYRICSPRDGREIGKDNQRVDIIKTEEGYDINLNGIEIGSYGIRQHEDLSWVYGTGLAEPRFSYAKDDVLIELANKRKSNK